ncbi:unnamed protein product [Didymodactylos carnosus]|uniref:Uncharacterized protein n=1 Tax=Didymodactylos carnosus TaxID=1234261 RepID=A0A815VFZ6_9BILA|nr:unnamed protein product [Didymodactylos carnosus]CAF4389165.1 unnamed protein product [Didymodactylos carnosus]
MQRLKLAKSKFGKWYEQHAKHCYKNYGGTSESMLKEGTIKLFQGSLSNDLRYKYMVCDSDASAYEAIKYHFIDRQKQKNSEAEEEEKEIMEQGTYNAEEGYEQELAEKKTDNDEDEDHGKTTTTTTSDDEGHDNSTATTSDEQGNSDDNNQMDDSNNIYY